MKKKIIIASITLIIVIAGSLGAYFYFTKEDKPVDESEKIFDKYKGFYNQTNFLRVDASLATQPLMDALVSYLADEKTLEYVKENYTNTHPGYIKLINGETDLIIVTEPSEEELALAEEANVELVVTKVVNEGFVFFVNSENPVDDLKLTDVVDIYSGKTNNWQTYGGHNAEIIAYQRPTNSGSQTGMLSLVMKDTPLKDPETYEYINSMSEIIDAVVSSYDNNIDGVGYSYYYYANTMYANDKMKFLSIDGVEPSYETIQNESYPIMTAYYIVTRKDANEHVNKLKEIILSNLGKEIAQGAGYVPIK